MKKTLFAISAIAVLLGFTACTSENEIVEPQVNGRTITIKASTEQPSATRTKLGEGEYTNYPVLWTADDKIRIVSATTHADFTLKNDYADQSTGKFEGSFEFKNEEYSAYYPTTYYDNENRKTIWPATQNYVANNIPQGVPMKATFTYSEESEEPSISFKNEGGILRLNLKGTAKVKSITVSATDLDPITLKCGEGVQLNESGVPFHIAVPGADNPGTDYSGLKIEITNDAGAVCTKTLKSDKTITVQRSMITDITLTAGSFVATTGTEKRTDNIDVNWVQLWAGGPKFAEYNVGAASATDYGGYYCWGNPNDQSSGWTGTSNTVDVASTLWGSNWRTPTKAELQALLDNCDVTWTDNYNSTGKKGRIYTGRGAYASNSVFLLSAGYYSGYGSSCLDQDGCYWSSTACDGNDGYLVTEKYYLNVGQSYQIVYGSDVAYGYSVRAVLNESAE